MENDKSCHANNLLKEAMRLYDSHTEIFNQSRTAWRGVFSSGAQWMRLVLSVVRGSALNGGRHSFQLYGVGKYLLALSGGMIALAMKFYFPWWVVFLVAILTFYAIEAQFVFLFPVLLDGYPRPIRKSLFLTRKAGGTISVMCRVMRIAVTMIFGGLLGHGFVRSWSVGCLAVCIWYEKILHQEPFGRFRFEIGTSFPLRIRRERFDNFDLSQPIRLLYASDLHLGRKWNRSVAVELIHAARRANPDLILLGGDLVDTHQGVEQLRRMIRGLARKTPIYAISGNHDERFGVAIIKEQVEQAGGKWLGELDSIEFGSVRLRASLAGSHDQYTILIAHEPTVFSLAINAKIRLVFAGHLHGGQCVWWHWRDKQYPGAWFSRWTGLRFKAADTTMYVSRGAADTLPFRWNCPREVIFCEIS